MFKEKRIMFLIAETPIHAGSGSEVGVIDLPIQRERHTDFPKIESSGLKGCLRDTLREAGMDGQMINAIFGPEDGETYAGAMAITDARILLFPVKSLKGVFAWITCPMVIERLYRDLVLLHQSVEQNTDQDVSQKIGFGPLTEQINLLEGIVPSGCGLLVNSNEVVLEELSIKVKVSGEIGETSKGADKILEWLSEKIFPHNSLYEFWRSKMKKDLIIVDDDTFTQFVRNSTEVVTRIRISDETGTAKGGGLWTEEYLPQDTILYSLVMFTDARKSQDNQGLKSVDLCKAFTSKLQEVGIVQIGGNATIGKGFARVNFYPPTQ